MSHISDVIRSEFKKGEDIRDAGLTTPENIVRYDDIAYGPDPRQQSLDVYIPKDCEGKRLPVIVSVHGGGWVYGDKERYQYYCMNLAQRGFAVVNFTYRLAPENHFPAPVEDTNAVFTWVLSNAERYGFDKHGIFAVGDSAGAHTLALYACICTNPACASQYVFRPSDGFAPAAIALNCGVYDVGVQKQDLISEVLPDYLSEEMTQQALTRLNVPNYITKRFPPAFIMTSTGDFLKEQAAIISAKLAESEVSFLYRLYGDSVNRLPHVFHCDIRSADAEVCNDEECRFFQSVYKQNLRSVGQEK